MKATKDEVNYSKGMAQRHCGNCKHYRDNECTLVQGFIRADMWCELWEKGNAKK